MPQHRHVQKNKQRKLQADQRQLRACWVRAGLNRTHNHMLAQSGGHTETGHTETAHALAIAAGVMLPPEAGCEGGSLGLEWVPWGGLFISTSSCLCLAAFSRLMRAAAAAALSCGAKYATCGWRHASSARQHSHTHLLAMIHVYTKPAR